MGDEIVWLEVDVKPHQTNFLAAWLMAAAIVISGHLIPARAQGAPPNDNFTNRIVLAGRSFTTTGSNVNATKELLEPDHADNQGGKSVWWSWTAPSTAYVSISTAGSSFDTLLSIYTGTSIARLGKIVSNDDYGGNKTSLVAFEAEAGKTYQIAVDGFYDIGTGLTDSGTIVLSLAPNPKVPAPSWEVTDLNGNPIRSSDFAGKVVLLNFWKTTCDPCVQEIPGFNMLLDAFRSHGLAIVGIAADAGGVAVVKPFMDQHPMNYTVGLVNDQVLHDYGDVPYIPTTFIIDRDNNLVSSHTGYGDPSFFEGLIAPLLSVQVTIHLTIQPLDSGAAISWPATVTGFVLESADSPLSAVWRAVTQSVRVTNNLDSVTVPARGLSQFYRLRKLPTT